MFNPKGEVEPFALAQYANIRSFSLREAIIMADSDLQNTVLSALKHYNDLEALQASPLSKLDALWPLPPSAAKELLTSQATGLAVRRLLDRAIERLRETLPEAADLLHHCFRLLKPIKEIGQTQSLTSAAIYAQRKKAIVALTAIIAEIAAEAAEARREKGYRQTKALPAKFRGQLIGVEGDLLQMQNALAAGLTSPNLIVITGLGGLGKTSLICEALRSWLKQEAPPIERVLWVTVKQANEEAELDREQQAPQALSRVLQQLGNQLELSIAALPNNEQRLSAIAGHLLLRYWQRFVIDVDHVKTRADAQLALTVVKSLLPLAQIVLTSRCDISHNQVQLIRLGELSEAHALELLRLEAKRHGYEPLSDDEAQQLYQQVGGHPLALKLVAAQVSCMPVAQVLSALHRESPLADELYSNVYESCWLLLTDLSREALLRLIRLPPGGASWEELQEVASICDESALERVVMELRSLNLLRVSISPTREYTYFLHRLTYRFLEYKMRMVDQVGLAMEMITRQR